MGAACTCMKKPAYPKANIIKRPTTKDFSLEEEDDSLLASSAPPQGIIIVKPPDNELARIGVVFQFDELAIAIARMNANNKGAAGNLL